MGFGAESLFHATVILQPLKITLMGTNSKIAPTERSGW